MSKPFKEEHTLGEFVCAWHYGDVNVAMPTKWITRRRIEHPHRIKEHMSSTIHRKNTLLFFVLCPRRNSFASCWPLIMQKSGSRKRNAFAQNTLIAFPLFARRRIDLKYQTLIRKSILSRQIWRWASFTMSSGSVFNSRRKKHCSCFARIPFLPMVSSKIINIFLSLVNVLVMPIFLRCV